MTATVVNPTYQANKTNNSDEVKTSQTKIGRTADVPAGMFDTFIKRQRNYHEALTEAGDYHIGEAGRNMRNQATTITYIARVPEAIRSRILSFEREEGWDLEDAKAVPLAACQSAIQFLETVLEKYPKVPIPQVSASVYGAVTLAWSKNRSHVAIRMFDEGATFYISEEPGGIRSRGYEDRQRSVVRVLDFFG